jgi:quinol monooxygenase YgiN
MSTDQTAAPSQAMLAHIVYFSLREPTLENRQALIAACHRYLTGHPGVLYFAAGERSSYDRSVNDRDYDVALMLVFESHAAHDAYQEAPRHRQFVEECKAMWKNVRVFDADVKTPAR